jgi:hypothetical protein
MNPLAELDRHWHTLQFLQMLLLFLFVIAYLTAIGRVWAGRGRRRAAALAAAAAVGLCLTIDPWTVGALMVAGAVGSVGLFVLATMFMSRAIGAVDTVVPASAADDAAAPLAPAADRRGRPTAARSTVTVG